MTKHQAIAIGIAGILFLVLFLGFDTIPTKQKDLEKSRLLNIETTSVANLIKEAMPNVDKANASLIDALVHDLEKVGTDTIQRIEKLKSLSGTWYDLGQPAIAGAYAQDIAELVKTQESWSIAGTTYAICVKNSEEGKTKDFCSKRAIKAFENAISLAPDLIEPRINLAICYVDNPDKDNPMQGILMLRELNQNHPENVSVLNQLAKLALQTNQIDRALERLEEAIQLEPDNKNTICLLANAYEAAGNQAKANEYHDKCVN
ncbi:MAG: hypothetical protein LC107_11055 [Chitinophagales bacterium]|nr:hypothetical protein [Chitinophagales bacterium]